MLIVRQISTLKLAKSANLGRIFQGPPWIYETVSNDFLEGAKKIILGNPIFRGLGVPRVGPQKLYKNVLHFKGLLKRMFVELGYPKSVASELGKNGKNESINVCTMSCLYGHVCKQAVSFIILYINL